MTREPLQELERDKRDKRDEGDNEPEHISAALKRVLSRIRIVNKCNESSKTKSR